MRTDMMPRLAAALVVLALYGPHAAAEAVKAPPAPAAIAEDHARGWFWYQDPPAEPKPVEKRELVKARPTAETRPEEDKADFVMQFEAFQKRIKESRMRFFIDPSPENAREMAELQSAMVRRASDAADVWQRVIWANPQFDFTLERPVSQVALAARDAEQRRARRALFGRLADSQVLYFFFRADCPYCHTFAPILAGFSKATGIRVFPVSLDGSALPDFPRAARDNGISKTLQVSTVPALFLADPARAQIAPVGYGVMSDTELAARIVAIAEPDNAELGAATPTLPLRQMEALR